MLGCCLPSSFLIKIVTVNEWQSINQMYQLCHHKSGSVFLKSVQQLECCHLLAPTPGLSLGKQLYHPLKSDCK